MNLLEIFFGKKPVENKADPLVEYGNNLFDCLKSLETGANKVSAWALSLTGGTLLIVLNTDYSSPKNAWRLIYLLFIVGWFFIGLCLYKGKQITGSTIASELYKGKAGELKKIFKNCNEWYAKQLLYFNLGLLFFGIWLVLYMGWWVFGDHPLSFICKFLNL